MEDSLRSRWALRIRYDNVGTTRTLAPRSGLTREETMEEYLKGLNPDQLEAATRTEGYLRVIAGAGSGKTKMLVSRYAYLVKAAGIDAASILCVTFTNKAAAEMRRRIRALIGEGHDTSLICTYHGFCVRLLREDSGKIFYPSNFGIIDEDGQKAILREIYESLELKLDHASFEKTIGAISKFKGLNPEYVHMMISRDDLWGDLGNESSDISLDELIIQLYLRKQKQLFSMDFDDLMLFALHLLKTDAEVREKWQRRLNYVQVDEFQDSSNRELELVDILSAGYGNLMVVGDPDQNIYEWRGSDVGLLVDFDADHVPTHTTTMAINYRSTPAILTCANELIRHNKLRIEKDLRSASPEIAGMLPIHRHADTEADEAAWVAERIKLGVAAGRRYADHAVLYRSGHLSRTIERALTDAGVPYEVCNGVSFYKRMEIRDAIAYLRLALADDDEAFERIVNKPARKMGKARLEKLRAAVFPGESLLAALERIADAADFKASKAAAFVQTMRELQRDVPGMSVAEAVAAVLDRTGYERYIREVGDMERFENIAEFNRIANDYGEGSGGDATLQMFLDHLALQTSVDFEGRVDKAKLMTIHASKGLEFPVVFVMGLSEGTFPSSRSIEERKSLGIEEERRLCYVAITRAREELYLTDSEGFSNQGAAKLPSRFLFEVGEDNYERIGSISEELRGQAERYAAALTPWEAAEKNPMPQMIDHPIFGIGKVMSTDYGRQSCEVRFTSGQTRNLSIDFVAAHPYTGDVLPMEAFAEASEPKKKEPLGFDMPAIMQREAVERPEKQHVVLPSKFRYKELTDDSSETNLWKRSDVPHDDWTCVGVTDRGKGNYITCEMCGKQHIRYVHHMKHPEYADVIDAGCVCAGWMEGDPEAARERERRLRYRRYARIRWGSLSSR